MMENANTNIHAFRENPNQSKFPDCRLAKIQEKSDNEVYPKKNELLHMMDNA